MRTLQHGLWLLSLCSTAVLASPGVLDQYDCHRDPKTDEYHCHGSDDQAKKSHILIGVINSNSVWLYSNGPYNLFSGIGAQLEIGDRHYAGYGSYRYEVHMTGSSDYRLSGWDVGVKLGPNIARIGLHPYVTGGYFSQNFILPSGTALPFDGFHYGAGLVWNRPSVAWDLRVANRTPEKLEANWASLGAPGLTHDFSVQLGFYLRR